MARITRKALDIQLARAVDSLEMEQGQLWIEHSGSGYAIRQQAGPGAHELECCMTASECMHYLRGVEIVALLQQRKAR